ncbi:hypothetical protein BGX23_000786 [Mortierella sp. AD031]|nr:hypothetical protein BGX23_000786 [Mortierella sp. AD031]
MGASLIATQLSMSELIGALLVGASIILSTHSLSRMIFLRRSGSKYHLFPIINIAQFINEFCVFFLITTTFNTISFETALWLNVINNICYFVTKPITMYLAYLRCSAVYPAFKKADWLHAFLIGFRAIELFAIVIINIIQNYLCNGSVAPETRCAPLAIAWTFRDAGAPIFRGYYILCEMIFYVTLFRTLKGMSGGGKNIQLKQYRQLQTTLFTADLILLIFMTGSDAHSSTSPSKLEMASIHAGSSDGHHHHHPSGGATPLNAGSTAAASAQNRKSFEQNAHRVRPLTQNSTSPLTSHAAETGYNSDYDLTGSGAASITTAGGTPPAGPASPTRSHRPSLQLQYQQQQQQQQQRQQEQLQLQQQQLQFSQRVVDDFQDYIPYGTTPTPISHTHTTSQDWLRSQPSNSSNQQPIASPFLRGSGSQSPSSLSRPRSLSFGVPATGTPGAGSGTSGSGVVTPPERSHVRPRQN